MPMPCSTPTPLLPGAQPPPTILPPPQLPPVNLGTFVVTPPPPVVPLPPPPPALVTPRFVSDFPLSKLWNLFWLATLARATYSPNGTLFNRAAYAVVPADYPITTFPNGAGLVPGFSIIKMPHGAVVVVSGTTNLAQWLEQTLNSVSITWGKTTPPGPVGGLKTLQIYATAAQTIWASLATHVPLDQQILFVGHSMGGAVATLLHAVAAAGDNGRVPSRLVTFASPKPGDSRCTTLTRTNAQVYKRLLTATDFVPSLPPNLSLVNLLIPGPLQAASDGWSQFQHAAGPTIVNEDGTLESGSDPLLLIQIGQALLAAATNQPVTFSAVHLMTEYVGRLYRAIDAGVETTPTDWQSPSDLLGVNAALTQAGY